MSRNCSSKAVLPLDGFSLAALPLKEFYLPRAGFLNYGMDSLPRVGLLNYEMNSLPLNGFYLSNGLPLVEVFYLPSSQCEINHNKIEKISKKILVKCEKIFKKFYINSQKILRNLKHLFLKVPHILRSDLISVRCLLDVYTAVLCQSPQSTQMKCKLLKIFIESSLYRKHDLVQKRLLIWKRNKVNIHMIFSSFFHVIRRHKNITKSLDVIPDISVEVRNNTAAIGGGNIPTFDKLTSYVQLGVCKKNVKYKFETHIAIVDASIKLVTHIV
jgi:hypothetical protein